MTLTTRRHRFACLNFSCVFWRNLTWLLMTLLFLQNHVHVLNNPPQPEDVDILDESGASAADDVALTVVSGAAVPETGDNKDLNPFHVKRSRPLSTATVDSSSYVVPLAAPSAEPSPAAVAPKRARL